MLFVFAIEEIVWSGWYFKVFSKKDKLKLPDFRHYTCLGIRIL